MCSEYLLVRKDWSNKLRLLAGIIFSYLGLSFKFYFDIYSFSLQIFFFLQPLSWLFEIKGCSVEVFMSIISKFYSNDFVCSEFSYNIFLKCLFVIEKWVCEGFKLFILS